MKPDILEKLEVILGQRLMERPVGSYASQLYAQGVQAIGEKVQEEAREVVEAAQSPNGKGALIHESADLVYHLMVLLAYKSVSLGEVYTELERRLGTSGLVEKANRQPR